METGTTVSHTSPNKSDYISKLPILYTDHRDFVDRRDFVDLRCKVSKTKQPLSFKVSRHYFTETIVIDSITATDDRHVVKGGSLFHTSVSYFRCFLNL